MPIQKAPRLPKSLEQNRLIHQRGNLLSIIVRRIVAAGLSAADRQGIDASATVIRPFPRQIERRFSLSVKRVDVSTCGEECVDRCFAPRNLFMKRGSSVFRAGSGIGTILEENADNALAALISRKPV